MKITKKMIRVTNDKVRELLLIPRSETERARHVKCAECYDRHDSEKKERERERILRRGKSMTS